MSAVEVLRMARENGVHLGIAGADLILDADREPAPGVVEALRRHKAGIIALLAAGEDDWTAEDWRVFYDERAGIAEIDGELPRPEAETRAFECCLVEWLNRHPQPSDPGRCAWCEKPATAGAVVVPFETKTYGHTWLHHRCWQDWSGQRRAEAEQALTTLGIGMQI